MDPDLFYSVLGSASAGIISRICTHPLDTAKARIQAPSVLSQTSTELGNKYKYKGPTDALIHTFRQDGIRGLYRGFGIILVVGTPGTILYLCSYEYFKAKFTAFSDNDGRNNSMLRDFGIHFSSGFLAETVACILYVPVDVIKERLQVQSISTKSSNYNGSLDACKKILKKK